MENTRDLKKIRVEPYMMYVCIMFAVCSILYYLPAIMGLWWRLPADSILNKLHDFYGMDFYALLFFIPVVFAAYHTGVIRAVFTAFLSMIIFIPYSMFITTQPGALFRPTAFVIILSAVGAVIAMLQRSDAQRRRNLNELNCLYDIGKAAENSDSVDKFLSSVLNIISQDLNQKGEIEVSITLRNKTYFHIGVEDSERRISEDIMVGGEVVGNIKVAYKSAYFWDKKSIHFVKALAERIGGAMHSIELEQSLKAHYTQLEEMVEARTRELALAHEKLIRTERLAAVGELASGVGHELRNPLNVIRNCVYLINMSLDGKATPDVEESLKLLDLQVDISNKIVTDLLDFTRVKKPLLSMVNLNNMVQDRVSWATIPENIKVIYDLCGNVPVINVDAEQIGRAVTNIINNAIQAIGNNGFLTVATGINGDHGFLKLTDSGCGIPEENLNKIFEPLFTTRPKGIGLGLAITKRMVEQNGGKIEVESTVGIGTTFTLILPLIKKEENQNEKSCQFVNR